MPGLAFSRHSAINFRMRIRSHLKDSSDVIICAYASPGSWMIEIHDWWKYFGNHICLCASLLGSDVDWTDLM